MKKLLNFFPSCDWVMAIKGHSLCQCPGFPQLKHMPGFFNGPPRTALLEELNGGKKCGKVSTAGKEYCVWDGVAGLGNDLANLLNQALRFFAILTGCVSAILRWASFSAFLIFFALSSFSVSSSSMYSWMVFQPYSEQSAIKTSFCLWSINSIPLLSFVMHLSCFSDETVALASLTGVLACSLCLYCCLWPFFWKVHGSKKLHAFQLGHLRVWCLFKLALQGIHFCVHNGEDLVEYLGLLTLDFCSNGGIHNVLS